MPPVDNRLIADGGRRICTVRIQAETQSWTDKAQKKRNDGIQQWRQ